MQRVITVGAVNANDEVWYVPSPPSPATGSNLGSAVDIWAPGGDADIKVKSASHLGDYNFVDMHGTSMASAFVSGVVARLLQERPTHDPETMLDTIKEIAEEKEGIVTGNRCAPNSQNDCALSYLIFCKSWLYPFHTVEEWQNSDWFFQSMTMYNHLVLWGANLVFDPANFEQNGLWVYVQNWDTWIFYYFTDNTDPEFHNMWVFWLDDDQCYMYVMPYNVYPSSGGPVIFYDDC
jgi:hypothetical protein